MATDSPLIEDPTRERHIFSEVVVSDWLQHYCRASILLHARCLGCIVLFFLFSDIYACYCHIYHLLFWKMISYNRQDICMQDNIGTYIPCQPILVYHGFLLADEGRHEESQIKQSFQRLQITEIASSYLEYLGIDRRVSCTCAWPWYRTLRCCRGSTGRSWRPPHLAACRRRWW